MIYFRYIGWRCYMRASHVAILILIAIVAGTLMSCGGDKKRTKFEGTLDSWSIADMTVTIDGIDYPLAEGMQDFEDRAEAGKKYEFTRDAHGSIIGARPLD
jgi:hypothetical protein